MERRVRNCLDVHGRRYGPAWAAYDGKMPSLPGWPRNPAAPGIGSFNISVLERELKAHELDVARAQKRSPTSSLASFVEIAARGRAASTRAAIHAAAN